MESLRAKMKTTQHLKVRETRLQSKNRVKLIMAKQTIILKDTTQFGDSTAVATTLETVKVFLKQFTVRPRWRESRWNVQDGPTMVLRTSWSIWSQRSSQASNLVRAKIFLIDKDLSFSLFSSGEKKMSSSMMESSTTGDQGDVVQAGDLVEAQDQVGQVAHHHLSLIRSSPRWSSWSRCCQRRGSRSQLCALCSR